MKYYSDDDLERALFALPLEEPPDGLRGSILAATIHRPPAAVAPWELWTGATLFAILVWLVGAIVAGSVHVPAAFGAVDSAVAWFAQPSTLLWAAVGGATAIWVSQLNLTSVTRSVRR